MWRDPYEWVEEVSRIEVTGIIPNDELEGYKASIQELLDEYPFLDGFRVKMANIITEATGDVASAVQYLLESASSYGSVALWVQIIKFIIEHQPFDDQDQFTDTIYTALDQYGHYFTSPPLWRMCIDYEREKPDGKPLILLARAVQNVTSDVHSFWEELQQMIPKAPISHLALFHPDPPLVELANTMPHDDDTIDDQEFRADFTARMTSLYEASLKEYHQRIRYEKEITRHHFHFDAIDDAQIENWEKYLDAMEAGFAHRHEELYERASIVLCNVDAFWLRYINFGEKVDTDAARSVIARAPVARMPRVQLDALEFEEVCDSGADYSALEESGNAMSVIAMCQWLKRTGRGDAVPDALARVRDAFLEAGDTDGAGIIAAEMLEFGIESTEIGSAVYLAKVAHNVAADDVDQANRMLFDAIFSNQEVLLEDKVVIFDIYMDYIRRWGIDAGFQMEMEIELEKMKSKLIWHKSYFDKCFVMSKERPHLKAKAWIAYQRSLE